MLPNDFEIKSYSLPSDKKQQNICTICNETVKMGRYCAFCGGFFCMNKCMVQILPDDVKSKPWLADKVMQYVCLTHYPKSNQIPESYIKKVFAQIFSENTDNQDDNFLVEDIEETPEIDTSLQQEKMDQLIGGILKSLKDHKRLIFDEKGDLSERSKSDIFNSIQQLIVNASQSI